MLCTRVKDCFGKKISCKNILLTSNSKIVCSENNKRYCLLNVDSRMVGKLHVDSGCIADNLHKKCDYIIEFNDGNDLTGIFIELKGINVFDAILQLESTLNIYSSFYVKCYARIIHSSGARFLSSDPKIVCLKKRLKSLGGSLRWCSNSFEEAVTSLT